MKLTSQQKIIIRIQVPKIVSSQFFRFPKSEELKHAWLNFLDRPNFVPTQASRVCSINFEQNCFFPKKKIQRLKSDAVPTIFPSFPKRSIPAEQSVILDHTYLLPPAKELKRRNNNLVEELGSLKKKIKLLQETKRKLTKKCNSLADIVQEIKAKKLASPSVCEVLGTIQIIHDTSLIPLKQLLF